MRIQVWQRAQYMDIRPDCFPRQVNPVLIDLAIMQLKPFPAMWPILPKKGFDGNGNLCIMRGSEKPHLSEAVMYAVIKTGGKQYRVSAGETLKIETVAGDVGSAVVLDKVLMVGDGDKVSVGKPMLNGATVQATIVSHGRGDKVRIFKMKRRKHYQKRQGHRQNYTEIRIDGISA
jgi:large subunit ribosomal protein L21